MTLEEKIRERVSSGENLDSIMALNYADRDPSASKEDIEDVYEYGSKVIESLVDTAIELHSFLEDLFR